MNSEKEKSPDKFTLLKALGGGIVESSRIKMESGNQGVLGKAGHLLKVDRPGLNQEVLRKFVQKIIK